MKIAIYHNLENGGALNQLEKISDFLAKNNKIDLYCHKIPKHTKPYNNIFAFPENKNSDILSDLYYSLITLKRINKEISRLILENKYDLVIIGACKNIQSPYLLSYLKNTIYIFSEPKREFYEKTSFYNNFKKILAKIVRLPLKQVDYLNCKNANLIVTNSQYSNFLLDNIYNKKGFVIYPGLKFINKQQHTLKTNKEILTIGQLSYLKGHHISLNQIENINNVSLLIIGRTSKESNYIFHKAKFNPNIKIIHTENNTKKNILLRNHSFYLANNIKEPFGLTTLEALDKKLFVFGVNTGGTSELVRNGLNGILFQNDKIAKHYIAEYLNKNKTKIYQLVKIDWSSYTKKLLKVITNNGQFK